MVNFCFFCFAWSYYQRIIFKRRRLKKQKIFHTHSGSTITFSTDLTVIKNEKWWRGKARGIFCLFFTVLFVDWWKMSSLPHTMVDPIFEVSLLEITKNWLCPSVLMPHHAKISSCSSKWPRVTSQDSSDRSHFVRL